MPDRSPVRHPLHHLRPGGYADVFEGLSSAGATLTVALYVYAKEDGEFGVAFGIAAILMVLALKHINIEIPEKSITAIGARIDEGYRTVENICLKLLLRQQPVARDLRVISAALKIIIDLERIGDHCTNIAEWVEFSVTGIHQECQ